jgi:hypothetical protein
VSVFISFFYNNSNAQVPANLRELSQFRPLFTKSADATLIHRCTFFC